MGQQSKISAPHQLFLYSFPLLLMLATFTQRGIIKTVVISSVSCEEPLRMTFVIPTIGLTLTSPALPWEAGSRGPKLCIRNLGIVLEKADCDLPQGSTYTGRLSTRMATRQDTEHIEALLLPLPFLQPPTTAPKDELWVLLH